MRHKTEADWDEGERLYGINSDRVIALTNETLQSGFKPLAGNIPSQDEYVVGQSYWTDVTFTAIHQGIHSGTWDWDRWSLSGTIYGRAFTGEAYCVQEGVWSPSYYWGTTFTVKNVEFVVNNIWEHDDGTIDVWLRLASGIFYFTSAQRCALVDGLIKISYPKPVPPKDDLHIYKVSSAWTTTDNLPTYYELAGAIFEIADSSFNVIATLTSGKGTGAYGGSLPTGQRFELSGWTANIFTVGQSYYWREVKAPKGFINSHPQWEAFVATSPETVLVCQDEPIKGSLSIIKKSSAPDITDNNTCYSLAGAIL